MNRIESQSDTCETVDSLDKITLAGEIIWIIVDRSGNIFPRKENEKIASNNGIVAWRPTCGWLTQAVQPIGSSGVKRRANRNILFQIQFQSAWLGRRSWEQNTASCTQESTGYL